MNIKKKNCFCICFVYLEFCFIQSYNNLRMFSICINSLVHHLYVFDKVNHQQFHQNKPLNFHNKYFLQVHSKQLQNIFLIYFLSVKNHLDHYSIIYYIYYECFDILNLIGMKIIVRQLSILKFLYQVLYFFLSSHFYF